MKKIYILLLFIIALTLCNIEKSYGAANSAAYDTSRIYNAMAKARAGDTLNFVMLGGSITNGNLATSESKRFTNLVTAWWRTNFPDATINLINKGIGGTGSDVGAFRTYDDVVKNNPDFVIVEFAVNDAGKDAIYVQKMMEGILQQLLNTNTAVMILMLRMESEGAAGTAQVNHKVVGNYYKVPMISYADLLVPALIEDGKVLRNVFGDNPGVHPNDLGMQYIADFIIDELTINLNNLPDDENLPEIDTILPVPLITDIYQNTFKFTTSTLIPVSNTGWTTSATNWKGTEIGQELSFEIDGNALAIQYTMHNSTERGQVEIWVDDHAHKTLNAYWTQTWGPATVFSLIEEGLDDTVHTVHIKVLPTSSTAGHTFYLLNILKAGNFKDAAPIALSDNKNKSLIDSTFELNANKSFDPDGLFSSLTFNWGIQSKPPASIALIDNPDSSVAAFIPDVAGEYEFELTVDDGIYSSVPFYKKLIVKSENSKPTANAGVDKNVAVKMVCNFTGNESYDADGDNIIYNWKVISQPASSNILLNYKKELPALNFYPKYEGDYVLVLTVNDSIADSEPDTIIVTAILNYISGFEENHKVLSEIKLYPNPVKDKLNVSFENSESVIIEISLLTLDGKEVFSESYQVTANSHYTKIDVSWLSPGSYLMKLKIGDKLKVQKFNKY